MGTSKSRLKLHHIIILLLIIVSLTIVIHQCTRPSIPEPKPLIELGYKYIFPFIHFDPCKYKDKLGAAWTGAIQYLDRLCASSYYHSNPHAPNYRETGGIPMLWCAPDSGGWQGLPTDYDAEMLFLNEPGRPDQCNIHPSLAARYFRKYEQKFLNAKLIGPNVITVEYIQPFIDYYEKFYGKKPQPYRWALHYYRRTHPTPWEKLDHFCSVLESNGYVCENIWITEFGYEFIHVDAYQHMYQTTRYFLEDPRVEKMFVYTAVDCPVWCNSIHLINDDGTFTITGEAYTRAVTE